MKGPELFALLTAITALPTMATMPRPERSFLLSHGWVPLGKRAFTDIEGWGKMIDKRAVTVDEPEALAMEGWGNDLS